MKWCSLCSGPLSDEWGNGTSPLFFGDRGNQCCDNCNAFVMGLRYTINTNIKSLPLNSPRCLLCNKDSDLPKGYFFGPKCSRFVYIPEHTPMVRSVFTSTVHWRIKEMGWEIDEARYVTPRKMEVNRSFLNSIVMKRNFENVFSTNTNQHEEGLWNLNNIKNGFIVYVGSPTGVLMIPTTWFEYNNFWFYPNASQGDDEVLLLTLRGDGIEEMFEKLHAEYLDPENQDYPAIKNIMLFETFGQPHSIKFNDVKSGLDLLVPENERKRLAAARGANSELVSDVMEVDDSVQLEEDPNLFARTNVLSYATMKSIEADMSEVDFKKRNVIKSTIERLFGSDVVQKTIYGFLLDEMFDSNFQRIFINNKIREKI